MERIELSEGNLGRRLAAVVALLAVAAIAFAYGVTRFFSAQAGWQTIEASSSQGPTCGEELTLLYELGAEEGSAAAAEGRALAALYSDTCRKLFQLFHTVEQFEGVVNLRELSLRPNETLTVDPMLYRAFVSVGRYGDRTIYLGPVYARYGDLFFCREDGQLTDFDPRLSADVAREYGTLAAYARDPGAIDLRLLGDDRVCLFVSEDYLDFARREGVDQFLNFGWLTNAFVVDAVAGALLEQGFTHGVVSSYDGFQRNLDDRGGRYSLNVLDYVDGDTYRAAVLEYQGARSIVCLRDHAVEGLDGQRIYRLKNGEVRTAYLSPEDGLCRSAVHDLTGYSTGLGCGEMALKLAPVYVADTLDAGALDGLAREGLQSIWCRDRVIFATEPGAEFTKLYEGDGVRYTVSPD